MKIDVTESGADPLAVLPLKFFIKDVDMKNHIALITMLCMLAACSNPASKDADNKSAAQKNIEVAHAITSAFEKGDTTVIDSLVAADYIDHREYGDVKGRDSLKALIRSVHQHVKNLEIKIRKELADDEYVMSWKTFSGKGDGQDNSTAGDFNVSGVQITRFKNGKATEHWEALDIRDVYRLVQKLTPAEKQ